MRNEVPRGVHIGKPIDGKPRTEAEHYMKCPACGGYYDMRDLGAVYDHEDPLPHPACDQVQ